MNFLLGFFVGCIWMGALFFTAGMCGMTDLEDDET